MKILIHSVNPVFDRSGLFLLTPMDILGWLVISGE
jgi:hypothetical protein